MSEQDMSLSPASAERLKQAFQQCRDIEGTLSEQLEAYAATEHFPLLNDLDNGYALSLNLGIRLGTEIQRLLSYQDLSNFHGNDGWVLPIPATFVVGRDGLVKARFVDPDFRKRMEIDDLIAALRKANQVRDG